MLFRRSRARLAALIVAAILAGSSQALAQGELGAIGRLTPKGGIITLSGTPGSPVGEILVAPDDQVKRGDVLMILGSKALLEIELALAEIERKAVERTGKDAIGLQKLLVGNARKRHERAEAELAHYRKLGKNAKKWKAHRKKLIADFKKNKPKRYAQLEKEKSL